MSLPAGQRLPDGGQGPVSLLPAVPHVTGQHRRHVLGLGKIAQPLIRLQQHRERQQMLRVLSPSPSPLRLGVSRGKRVSQFPS